MQMLWARVVSDGVRAMAPEVVAGYYTPEELDESDGDADQSAGKRKVKAATPATNGAATVTTSPPAAAQGEQAPFDDGVIDASFEVTPKQAVELGSPVTATPDATYDSSPEATDSVPAGVATGGLVGNSMLETDPCTPVQVNQIRSLINDISAVQPGIVNKIKAQLAASGREKIAELNFKEAAGLLQALMHKAHQVFAEEALKSKAEREAKN